MLLHVYQYRYRPIMGAFHPLINQFVFVVCTVVNVFDLFRPSVWPSEFV